MALSKRKIDEYYMHGALSLALRGTGKVSPNPLVGCVVVKDGSVISRGWHRGFGLPHAEAMALEGVEDVRGATLYVNLEPCSHQGKTPPCAPLIAERGVTRVVAGIVDPDSRVQGRGLNLLREKGIQVETGVLEAECRWLNRGFIRRNALGRPWVTVKGALSLDGGMALESGESKWITGPSARSMGHLLRGESDALLIGAGTAARDDPELTVRSTWGRSPLRVLLDSNFSLPESAKMYGKGTLVVTDGSEGEEKRASARRAGMDFLAAPGTDGGLSLRTLLSALADRGVSTILVEGGPRVIASFFREGLVDSVSLFLSPRIMGRNLPFSGDLSFSAMEETIVLKNTSVKEIGGDFFIEGVPACSPDL